MMPLNLEALLEIFSTMFTRPDIAYMVSKLCQFLRDLAIAHWAALKHVICYLKATLHNGVLIQNITLGLI